MDDDRRPDFSNNREWFDIKILAEGKVGSDNTVEMNKRGYIKFLSAMFEELGVPTNKYGHWGQMTAPVELEFTELTAKEIWILGKCLFFNFFYFKLFANINLFQVTGI